VIRNIVLKDILRHSCLIAVTRPSDRHLTSASAALCRHTWHFINLLIIIITRHSLDRAKGEVLVLLYVFFVRSTISRQPEGRFTSKFACVRTLVPDVSSPLLGVSVPWGAEKGGNEIFVTMGINGEFLHFGGFSAISQQHVHGSTPNFIFIGTMSAYVPLPAVGFSGPWRRVEKELKTQKNGGWSHSCIGQLPFLFSQRFQMWFNM